jgi:tellurite resistance protein TehA-like permease
VIGARAALGVDWALWSLGTALGLATACTVPYLMVTRHRFAPDAAFGGWLMPVVPPLVSATTGALLVPHTPAGQLRLALLLGCYAMFGLGLVAALLVLAMVYSRLVHHDVPTVWIGLGALGQVVTGLGALATAAPSALPAPYAHGAAVFALLGGVGVWGFAMLWLALAAALTVREFRAGLPFAPTWWSFHLPPRCLRYGHRRPRCPYRLAIVRLGCRRPLHAARRRMGRGGLPLTASRRCARGQAGEAGVIHRFRAASATP